MIAEIAGIVVDNEWRRLGIGKELMKAAENWAKQKQCKMISLRSNVNRKEAHEFYKTLGYKSVKEQYTFRKELM